MCRHKRAHDHLQHFDPRFASQPGEEIDLQHVEQIQHGLVRESEPAQEL